MENEHAKPFLKWAGGKRRLLPYLIECVPKYYNNYYEPFLGGGSLFFAIKPQNAYLSDLNSDLINTYTQIKNNVDLVIRYLRTMKYGTKSYDRIREMKYKSPAKRAAKFIYLNKTCWNGLYRVNKAGNFNVPIGRYTNPTICNRHHLRYVSRILKNAYLRSADFEEVIKSTKQNDLIYFDPPYTTSHKNNNFIEYNAQLFSPEDQERLHKTAIVCHTKGCKIIISNADHKFITNLYKDKVFHIIPVKRRSVIAAKVEKRKEVTELIITNYKIDGIEQLGLSEITKGG